LYFVLGFRNWPYSIFKPKVVYLLISQMFGVKKMVFIELSVFSSESC